MVPHDAAVVCHGGAGTLRALASGVPLVMVPLFADQARNARRVADLCAGISLPELPNLASAMAEGPAAVAAWLGPAVRAVLDDPSYRRGAQRVAAAIHTLPPVDAALDVFRDCVIGNGASSTGPI